MADTEKLTFDELITHWAQEKPHQTALEQDGEAISFADLEKRSRRIVAMLRARGVEKGDRVIIYMPMVAEAVIAMLACARLGAIHSVVFGGFASNELAVRIDDARPKVIVSASCGVEVNRVIEYMPLLNGAIDIATHKPENG